MPEKMRIYGERLADDRALGRRDLVQSPDGGRVGGVPRDLRPLGRGLAQDRGDRLGERVERLARLGLGRLDHQRLVDEQREVDGRGMEAVVEQPLGEVERLQLQLALHRAAREHELVHAQLSVGERQVLGDDARPRAGARAGSWRSAPPSRRRPSARRRRASRCRRRRARSSRSCRETRAAARSCASPAPSPVRAVVEVEHGRAAGRGAVVACAPLAAAPSSTAAGAPRRRAGRRSAPAGTARCAR